VVADAGSVNFDLDGPDRDGRLLVDALVLQPQVLDIGDFDLEAMMIRLAFLWDRIGARPVAIDNVQALLAAFRRPAMVGSESAVGLSRPMTGVVGWIGAPKELSRRQVGDTLGVNRAQASREPRSRLTSAQSTADRIDSAGRSGQARLRRLRATPGPGRCCR
jgi:hypothetical protein